MIPRRILTCFGVLCGVALLAGWLRPTSAEVAAHTDETGRVKIVMILLGLTEDGEPILS